MRYGCNNKKQKDWVDSEPESTQSSQSIDNTHTYATLQITTYEQLQCPTASQRSSKISNKTNF